MKRQTVRVVGDRVNTIRFTRGQQHRWIRVRGCQDRRPLNERERETERVVLSEVPTRMASLSLRYRRVRFDPLRDDVYDRIFFELPGVCDFSRGVFSCCQRQLFNFEHISGREDF